MKSLPLWRKSFQTQTNLLKKAGYGATLSGYTVSYIPTVLRNDALKLVDFFGGEGEIWTLAPEKTDLHP